MPHKLPIDKPEYWCDRLKPALQTGRIHASIYDVSIEVWENIQSTHKKILDRLLSKPYFPSILDAGCGYGALLDILPLNISYVGIDLSPDLLVEARNRHPTSTFYESDMRDLSWIRERGTRFNYAVCRSIEGMVKDHLGWAEWKKMEAELLSVSDHLILLNYTEPTAYKFIDTVVSPEHTTGNTLATEEGYLKYRLGQSGTCEIYDLFVEEEHRRKGVATKLIKLLMDGTTDTVYAFTRKSNHAARSLYMSLGFDSSIYYLPGFYEGEDGVLYFHNRGK